MLKRWGLVVMLFILTGCSGLNTSDIEGFIYERNDSVIKVAIFGDDPEAEYPVYEIAVNENTMIENEEILKLDDFVEIWLVDEDTDQKVAEKIRVKNEKK